MSGNKYKNIRKYAMKKKRITKKFTVISMAFMNNVTYYKYNIYGCRKKSNERVTLFNFGASILVVLTMRQNKGVEINHKAISAQQNQI